eukprot:gene38107-42266_t
MVRSLASHLAMVTCKDMLRIAMRNTLRTSLEQEVDLDRWMAANPGSNDIARRHALSDAADQLTKDNLPVGVGIQREALQRAGQWRGEVPAELLPQQPGGAALWVLLRGLPEPLRPSHGLLYTQKKVYEDFRHLAHPSAPPPQSPEQNAAVENLQRLLASIDDETRRHYARLPAKPETRQILSLKHPSFMDTAVACARHVFQRVFALGETIQKERRDQSDPHTLYVAELDIAVSFTRLRLVDINELDKCLTSALTDRSAGPSPPRVVVEFAASFVQKCLIDERLATQKELRHTLAGLAPGTLDALEKVAVKIRSARQQKEKETEKESLVELSQHDFGPYRTGSRVVIKKPKIARPRAAAGPGIEAMR